MVDTKDEMCNIAKRTTYTNDSGVSESLKLLALVVTHKAEDARSQEADCRREEEWGGAVGILSIRSHQRSVDRMKVQPTLEKKKVFAPRKIAQSPALQV